MTTTLDIQRALIARGYDIGRGGADGVIGPATLGAVLRALDKLPVTASPPRLSTWSRAVPFEWMPWAHMQRIIVHWTAGGPKASADDREHYHLLLEDDATLVRGTKSILDNVSAADGVYAGHTLGCNTQSIGVSLCGMRAAVESPFRAGTAPITRAQWDALPGVLADLCRRYSIPVTPQTVLSHAEVQATLGIRQKGKWDIARLPFEPSLVGARAIGDRFRSATKALL
jgi:hypothetical protein